MPPKKNAGSGKGKGKGKIPPPPPPAPSSAPPLVSVQNSHRPYSSQPAVGVVLSLNPSATTGGGDHAYPYLGFQSPAVGRGVQVSRYSMSDTSYSPDPTTRPAQSPLSWPFAPAALATVPNHSGPPSASGQAHVLASLPSLHHPPGELVISYATQSTVSEDIDLPASIQRPEHSPTPVSSTACTHDCNRAQEEGKKIPRPANKFMIYRSEKSKELKLRGNEQGEGSKTIAQLWREEPKDVKQKYEIKQAEAKAAHAVQYPNYKYKPQKKTEAQQRKQQERKAKKERSAVKGKGKQRADVPDPNTQQSDDEEQDPFEDLQEEGSDVGVEAQGTQSGFDVVDLWDGSQVQKAMNDMSASEAYAMDLQAKEFERAGISVSTQTHEPSMSVAGPSRSRSFSPMRNHTTSHGPQSSQPQPSSSTDEAVAGPSSAGADYSPGFWMGLMNDATGSVPPLVTPDSPFSDPMPSLSPGSGQTRSPTDDVSTPPWASVDSDVHGVSATHSLADATQSYAGQPAYSDLPAQSVPSPSPPNAGIFGAEWTGATQSLESALEPHWVNTAQPPDFASFFPEQHTPSSTTLGKRGRDDEDDEPQAGPSAKRFNHDFFNQPFY